ncbi:MAG TPA: decarboxylating 6-phosphogluconate dehydrogenase [Candidatus Acidoferrum sp.]|nr:decarboxylating 6-phosphogluconate dehydrogenase [Candidatus Acidoferrum sp.]
MQIGMVGLGRMGANMVRRLVAGGHRCVVYDRNADAVTALRADGAIGAGGLDDLVKQLDPPRAVWVMVPSGQPTEETIAALAECLHADDTIVDGGNSYFKDDVRRARAVAGRGIHYVDAGTSGGVWGVTRGYCLMVGGPRNAVERIEPILRTLAPGPGEIEKTPGRRGTGTAEHGYLHCGPVGAGHFVKMIHNGIEYGLMQAYAEGFDILRNAGSDTVPVEMRYDLDLPDIAELWRRASVVSSWLLDLTSIALAADPELDGFTGVVQDSGEGRWTVQAAIDEAVPADVLTASLYARFRSRQQHTFGEKLLSAMRQQFGGHREPK